MSWAELHTRLPQPPSNAALILAAVADAVVPASPLEPLPAPLKDAAARSVGGARGAGVASPAAAPGAAVGGGGDPVGVDGPAWRFEGEVTSPATAGCAACARPEAVV